MRHSYGYIDDDRVTVTRPQAIREVHAIEILRAGGGSPYTAVTTGPPAFLEDLQAMIRKGWRRSNAEYGRFKNELWESNRQAVWRILNDLPGEI